MHAPDAKTARVTLRTLAERLNVDKLAILRYNIFLRTAAVKVPTNHVFPKGTEAALMHAIAKKYPEIPWGSPNFMRRNPLRKDVEDELGNSPPIHYTSIVGRMCQGEDADGNKYEYNARPAHCATISDQEALVKGMVMERVRYGLEGDDPYLPLDQHKNKIPLQV